MAAILAHNLHILLHNLTTVTDLGDIGCQKVGFRVWRIQKYNSKIYL